MAVEIGFKKVELMVDEWVTADNPHALFWDC